MTRVARFEASTAQTISTNTNITFNTSVVNTTTGATVSGATITLAPGTYSLEGQVGAIDGNAIGGNVRVYSGFFNVTSSQWIGTGGQTASGNAANNNAQAYTPATAVLTVTATTTVNLRVNSASTANLSANFQGDFGTASLGRSWIIITQY